MSSRLTQSVVTPYGDIDVCQHWWFDIGFCLTARTHYLDQWRFIIWGRTVVGGGGLGWGFGWGGKIQIFSHRLPPTWPPPPAHFRQKRPPTLAPNMFTRDALTLHWKFPGANELTLVSSGSCMAVLIEFLHLNSAPATFNIPITEPTIHSKRILSLYFIGFMRILNYQEMPKVPRKTGWSLHNHKIVISPRGLRHFLKNESCYEFSLRWTDLRHTRAGTGILENL